MKRFYSLTFVAVIGLAISSWAAAPKTSTVKPGEVQNYPGAPAGLAPYKAGATCTTRNVHNAGNFAIMNLYTSGAWYTKAEWKAVNAAGTEVVVQRKLGNNTTGMPGSKGEIVVNRQYTTYAVAPFGNNTSLGAVTVCQDRQ